jgi:glycosyltransferase involved in cell wall biosynthesis
LDSIYANRVTSYAANSAAVADRIARFWDREASVIHPPVNVDFFTAPSPAEPTRDYVLGFGRWIPYKGLHKVIEAAELAGVPVKIAGRGPERARIEAAATAARVPVEIIHSPDDNQLRELYRNAACLVFPTVEDFGMVPVECQAAGTPVVAVGVGGATETIRDGRSGLLAGSSEPNELAYLIPQAIGLAARDCVESALRFDHASFRRNLRAWMLEHVA